MVKGLFLLILNPICRENSREERQGPRRKRKKIPVVLITKVLLWRLMKDLGDWWLCRNFKINRRQKEASIYLHSSHL